MPRQYTRLFVTPAVFLVSWLAFVAAAWSLDRGAAGLSFPRAAIIAVPAALVHGSVVLLYHNRWWHMATRRILLGSIAAGLATALTLFSLLEHLREPLQQPIPSFLVTVGGVVLATILMTLVSVLAVGAR
jgi:hypothetical protein